MTGLDRAAATAPRPIRQMDDVVEQGIDDVIKMGDSGTRLP